MRPSRARAALALAVSFSLAAALACGRTSGPSNTSPAATPVSTQAAASAAAAPASATPTPADTPVAGANFKIGNWTVITDRFRAQVADPEGVNIRSSPEVKPDNRTGSLPAGSTVQVEGRVLQGQEAVAGQGTTWYYVGTAGSTPQFVYAPNGTLTPLTGSATASASATAPATLTPTP